ncbi:ThiF family adenylyltransferase [Thalassoglobus polymorphus]|uniref:Thiamine biosynthesis protein ThiF n=1 Tax=Thalassoglobus polymorphus TaxID=2527994 RepID=A0A517QKR7_9PLAN|nr:ThiF family adenylyltransferase [Thalassoglobus polymorphus]QDT32236.1 thiamine biosynthesis protein ThiF [Thalassoglobus polymorphus]
MIGVGAIGRQVALQLDSIGVRQIQLIDFDAVEATNITTQGYFQDDLGTTKIKATAEQIQHIDPDINTCTIQDRYGPCAFAILYRASCCSAGASCCYDGPATSSEFAPAVRHWRIPSRSNIEMSAVDHRQNLAQLSLGELLSKRRQHTSNKNSTDRIGFDLSAE